MVVFDRAWQGFRLQRHFTQVRAAAILLVNGPHHQGYYDSCPSEHAIGCLDLK
jgi:hypothetical protein